jgi:hypothetical protein
MTDVFSGWMWNVGLFERATIYPIMVGHVLLGTGLIAVRRHSITAPLIAG